jgi:D-aminopeptidase
MAMHLPRSQPRELLKSRKTMMNIGKPRARDLGVMFDGQPGPWNAITDVPGVAVGHETLIEGDHIRTGVTAVLPLGRDGVFCRVPGAYVPLNGNGEITGVQWLEESGMLDGPLLLTNTHSVGVVRDAVISWLLKAGPPSADFLLPVVSETYDGMLNDINGQHVTAAHVHRALDAATSGPVAEGCVGGGTGMITHGWKGGIGTSSRVVEAPFGRATLGVLVQSNYGARRQLTISGVPVGREIAHSLPTIPPRRDGSIVAYIGTDAPLLPHQLKRLARRAGMGLARLGSVAHDSSGDLFLAFSTAEPEIRDGIAHWRAVPYGESINPLFQAVVEAMEEAIVNALVAAYTMTGFGGAVVHALPHEELRAVLARYNRLGPADGR